jgi:tRNA A58 N-methylase Trm61
MMDNKRIYRDVSKFTLQDVAQRKAEVRQEIHEQENAINHMAQDLIDPIRWVASIEKSMIKSIDIGTLILKGVMIGMKIYGKIRKSSRNI